jgi:hypothetical protein
LGWAKNRKECADLIVHQSAHDPTGDADLAKRETFLDKANFSSVQGLFRLLKRSYRESYCLFL